MNFKKRLNAHIYQFLKGYHGCKKLCNAFKKYSPESWTNEILFVTQDREEGRQKEIEFINKLNSIDDGYNILKGGQLGWFGLRGPNAGRVFTEEWRYKLSQAHLGVKVSQERAEHNRTVNIRRSPSRETRDKLRQSKLGKNNPMFGKVFTDIDRQKLSISVKNGWAKRKLKDVS